MGEAIGTAITELCADKLMSRGYKEIKSVMDLDSEVKRLQDTRTMVQAALCDAESMLEHSYVQEDVLEKLSCQLNRLVDLLDARAIIAKNRALAGGNRFIRETCLFFSASNQLIARFKDAQRVKYIRKKLDSIATDYAQFGSIVNVFSTHQAEARSIQRAGRHMISDVVIGRYVERNNIVAILSDNSVGSRTFSVASIVGIGGIGKTTLARYAFRDKRVKSCFDVQFWVDTTQGFDVEKVLEKIIASTIDENETFRYCDIDQLFHHFLLAIAGKKFLLVLDNMWDKTSLRLKWLELSRLLAYGASGSKVLITTRDQTVLIAMDSIEPYILGDLTEEDSWLLFQHIAFTQLQEPGVKSIGKDIAKMSPNVPLVIRSIAGILAEKCTVKEWKAFRDDQRAKYSTYGNDVMQTLKLSYDQLDAEIKLCVAYCSLFPKGFEYVEHEMINLWISLGYIERQYSNQSLEEVGEACVLSLVKCGFFRWTGECSLEMHDVMHDVVLMVCGNKYKMADSNTVDFDDRVRHVSIGNVVDSSWDVLSSLSKLEHLESFLVVPRHIWSVPRNFLVYYKVKLSRYQCLRVLDLHGIWIKNLPASLGEMISLRHLNLSETAIVKLPDSVSRLVHLLTLNLHSCINLQELPRDISKLEKLRHLQLSGNFELTHMPTGLGKLTNLQTLDLFVVTRSKLKAKVVGGLADLKNLNSLQGELSIQVLKQPKDIVLSAKTTNLKMKKKLIGLSIEFWDSIKTDEMVLEGLEPHVNLRNLKIRGYGGERLPSWMLDDHLHFRLPNLVQLKILNCKICTHLCSLGSLPHLKDLILEGLDNVEYIEKKNGSMIMGEESNTHLFPRLEKFRLKGMPKLKGWWMMPSSGDHNLSSSPDDQDQTQIVECKPPFPRLLILTMDSIKLAKILISRGPKYEYLQRLNISENLPVPLPSCQGQTFMRLNSGFPRLRWLQFSGNPEIKVLPEEFRDFSSLQILCINNCKQLKAIPEWIDSLTYLENLQIWACPQLESLPHQISNLSNLTLLGINGCSRIFQAKCSCKNPIGEYWPYIQHINYVNITASDSVDYSLCSE